MNLLRECSAPMSDALRAAWQAAGLDDRNRLARELGLLVAMANQTPLVRGHVALLHAQHCALQGTWADAARHLADAETHVARGADAGFDSQLDLTLGRAHAGCGLLDSAIAALERAWQACEPQGRNGWELPAFACARQLGLCAQAQERWDDAEAWLARAHALAVDAGHDDEACRSLLDQATAALRRGDHAAGLGDVLAGRQAWHRAGHLSARAQDAACEPSVGEAQGLQAEAAVRSGPLALAEEALAHLACQASAAWPPSRIALLRARCRVLAGHERAGEAGRSAIEDATREAIEAAEEARDLAALDQALDLALAQAAARADGAAEALLLRRQRDVREDLAAQQTREHSAAVQALLETERMRNEAMESEVASLRLQADNLALRHRAQLLSDAAQRDPLTGLANRRHFDLEFARRHARAQQAGHSLPLAIVDVDHFKRINDTHGHPAGDAVLKRLAAILLGQCRRGDFVARLGGEEFAVLLGPVPLRLAVAACERARVAVEADDWSRLVSEDHITISIGLVDSAAHADVAAAIASADVRLYAAKREGRNRVVGSD
jgi:diguanylate cyclase (GGDEF)-like protein